MGFLGRFLPGGCSCKEQPIAALVVIALAVLLAAPHASAHDISTDYAGEPLVHVTFDGRLSNDGSFPVQPRMVEVGGAPSADAPQYVEGRFGQAIKFDGDRLLELPIDITEDIYPQVTVTGWVYIDDENGDSSGILVSNNSFLMLQLFGGQFWMKTGKQTDVRFNTVVVPRYRWVFFAGVWDSATNQATAYIDQRVRSGDMTLDTAGEPDRSVWVGTHKVSSASILKGIRIDDLRIYPGALSAAQIRDVWSGSAASEGESTPPASTASGDAASTDTGSANPAGVEDKSVVYQGDPGDQPLSGTSEIEESLAEGELSYDPSAPALATDDGVGISEGAEETAERRVIGWTLSQTDTHYSGLLGEEGGVVREMKLDAGEGLRRIGWDANLRGPCRLKIGATGSSWRTAAGQCKAVTASKDAALSSAYIDEVRFESGFDKLSVSGPIIDAAGEFGMTESDETADADFLELRVPGRSLCRDGYIATGIVAQFNRRTENVTQAVGMQLICAKVEKIYE